METTKIKRGTLGGAVWLVMIALFMILVLSTDQTCGAAGTRYKDRWGGIQLQYTRGTSTTFLFDLCDVISSHLRTQWRRRTPTGVVAETCTHSGPFWVRLATPALETLNVQASRIQDYILQKVAIFLRATRCRWIGTGKKNSHWSIWIGVMLRCQVIIRFTDQYIRQLYPNVRMRRWAWRVDPGPEKLAKFSLLTCAQVLIPKVVCHAAGNQRVLHTYTIHSRLKGVWTYLINKRKLCLYAMKGGKIGESGGLTFWLASPGDYDDVMAISDGIYEGNDYLPHRYHSWMTEPHRLVILAKRDGKLVALESRLIVEGGSTVVLEGLRVCPSERGRGLAGVIFRFADQYIRQLYPNVRMKRWAWGEDPGPEKLAKVSLLTKRAILSLQIEAKAFDAFLSTLRAKLEHEKGTGSLDQESRLVVLEEEQLRHILLDPGVSSQIELPGDVIIQDWQPLKLLESNLEVLQRRNLTWLADGLEKPTFLSLHTPPYPIPYKGGSFYFSIDLFGTKPDLAYRALLAHMEMVRGEIRCMVLMRIYMHQSLWGRLRAFCECSAGVELYNGYWEQLILEHKL
ncbi:N-acetyltransferase 16, like isoform X9 [Brienomyrus brachyistius]|uniref:N-acetyltransferase 16, like isoform X9 n=1 Tax=Brienomyrus brachyistius TaxID=42636 RepID=UPI0020B30452|nr:N-acetyltransferase 16, like isoform X9 [Brienomyrus brachyistius]